MQETVKAYERMYTVPESTCLPYWEALRRTDDQV